MLQTDAAGKVVAASAGARQLWPERPIVGEALPSLFSFEIVSTDPEFLEAQWDVLRSSPSGQPMPLTTLPDGGSDSREVQVALESALDPAHGFHVVITLPGASPRAGTPGGDGDTAREGLRLLFENGSAGYFDLNLREGQVHLSAAWKKLLGYAPPELPDTVDAWRRLLHPDDSSAAPDKVGRRTAAGTRPLNVEFRMKHRRGHWVWIQCLGLQIVGPDGKVDRVVGLHLDISERKEIEDSLVANDARLQDLSGAGPLAVFELDFANQLFCYSPAWEKLLGYAEGRLPPTRDSFAAAIPADEAAAGVEPWLLNRFPGQTSWVETVRLRARDGKAVAVLFGAHRSVSRKRELLRVVGFCAPLPATAIAGDDCLGRGQVTGILDAVSEGILVTDERSRITVHNLVAARLLHVPAAELSGQLLGDVFRLVKRQGGRPAEDPVETLLAADEPLGLIATDALAPSAGGGDAVPIVWTARALPGPEGRPQGLVLVFRNPDEMTLTPDELMKADRFEHLGLLASGIAHDFNNHLTTILGAISLATEKQDYSRLADAEKSCDTAKGLTRQLLAFAKGGTGTRSVCASRDIMEDARRVAAAGSGAEIVTEFAADADNVLVDRAQILQVFQNLIVNALQAMPPPPHRQRLQLKVRNCTVKDDEVPGLAAGGYVEFEVRDNGSGIKPEHIDKIFDPFFTTKKHGTGLGLATVLKIVLKHGGQIGLNSVVGVGTAFTVYLPRAEAPVDLQPRAKPLLQTHRTYRVLFMDDDPKISDLTAGMLQSLGYSCDLARNGDEAVALFRRYQNLGKSHYDAVIMDLTVVGGMGGEECFYELRKLDPNVRAIVASGYDNDDVRREYFEKGFLGYLTKPYREKDLGRVLKEVVG
ncbi:MAG: PAS domain-containing protein [Verrucomicrobia bacterium]|nr:PAS domain-containing protein [Verrucomicrobiota bacterium]